MQVDIQKSLYFVSIYIRSYVFGQLHYPFTNKALKVIGIFTILVIVYIHIQVLPFVVPTYLFFFFKYPYLASDAVEPFTNWTFELVQVIRNKTPSFTIRSLAVE